MNLLTNWKTTLAGITTILGAVALITKMLSTGAFDSNTIGLAFTQLLTGVGILFAKDVNVTGAGADATAVK